MEKKATWIWYPGDFEVWLGNRFNNRRTERGSMFPPFWKQDSHWPTVVFATTVQLEQAEDIRIFCEGQYNVAIDGSLKSMLNAQCSMVNGQCSMLNVPAGKHRLTVKVWNQATPPALFIDSPTIKTGEGWEVTFEDKIWIDENGVAHGSGIYVPVGHASERADGCVAATLRGVAHDGCAAATLGGIAHYTFDSPDTPPSKFRLPTKPLRPVCCDSFSTSSSLYDFGRETFGFLCIHGLRSEGLLRIYYGESREEALDHNHCETLDVCPVSRASCMVPGQPSLHGSKAFRYVSIEKEGTADFDDLTMLYEYAPFAPEKSGSFRCSDEELNRIWEVSAYTLDLTTREFFCDGIKRDRWVWSGDAIQSYLMNYYLRFDTECVKRTIRQLRGKDPVTTHVNTIMDYTFYWFISIWQYYEYTGDVAFLHEMFPKMKTLMDFVLSRLNNGLAEGKADDWIFVDWTDFPMHKRGTLCFEQLLLWKSFEAMLNISSTIYQHTDNAKEKELLNDCLNRYLLFSDRLPAKIRELFYDKKEGVFLHAIENEEGEDLSSGELNRQVTKFPNMFAILYNFATTEEALSILKNVLLNPDVPPITTPYMRFYELETLCKYGLQQQVLREMKSYWGGMLREGATSFWEKYNPEEKGTEHLAMYGRPYGKSLCHAWGASPLYIIGRYFLGVGPVKPGYEEYEVRPVLGGLEWMEGDVPTPFGKIHVKMDKTSVTVHSDGGQGQLILGDKSINIPANEKVTFYF